VLHFPALLSAVYFFSSSRSAGTWVLSLPVRVLFPPRVFPSPPPFPAFY